MAKASKSYSNATNDVPIDLGNNCTRKQLRGIFGISQFLIYLGCNPWKAGALLGRKEQPWEGVPPLSIDMLQLLGRSVGITSESFPSTFSLYITICCIKT